MESKNRRLLALAFAAVMSLSMSSCGDKSSNEDTTEENTTAATQAETEEATEADTEEATEEETTEATEAATEEEEPAADAKPLSEILAEIPKAEAKSASLKEVGKLEGEDIEDYAPFLYKEISEEEIQCLDYTGKPLLDGKVDYIDDLGNTGLYVYYVVPDGDISYCGLMDAEGNIILSADEKVGTFDAVDDRFVKAYLPEAVTTDRDNAIYYSTSRMFSVDVGEDDVMYSGTVKLYDTKEHKFLENTAQKSDPNYKIGNDIITFYDDNSKTVAVTTDDKLIDVEGKSVVGDLITEYSSGKTVVYDKDMKKLFTTDYSISEMTDTHEYYSIYDSESGKRGVIHKSGTVMIEPKYGSISYLSDGVFSYYFDDYDKQGLLYADGTELTKDDYKSLSATGIPGYFNASTQDSKYTLLDAEGNEVIKDADYRFNEGNYFASNGDYEYFIINSGESLKMASSGDYYGNNLIGSRKDNAIFDLVTGEKVLEGFERSYQAYGYIYAVKDGETTIYQVETAE